VNLFCKNVCVCVCVCVFFGVLSEMERRNKVRRTLDGS